MGADLAFDVVELAPCIPAVAGPTLRETRWRRNAWLPDEIDRLRTMFLADETPEAMAASLGRTVDAVRDRVCILGWRRNSTRPWSELDDQEMRRRYGLAPAAEVAAALCRSPSSVYARAAILGLTEPNHSPWSEWEVLQMREGYRLGTPVHQIAILIGRSASGVASKAGGLGIRHANEPIGWSHQEAARAFEIAETGVTYEVARRQLHAEGYPERSAVAFKEMMRKVGHSRGWGRPWTPDEEDLVRHAYKHGLNLTPLMERLGRKKTQLRWKVAALGLQGTHPKPDGNRGGPPWTEAECAFVRAHYATMKPREIAIALGRTLGGVYNQAWSQKLSTGRGGAWSDEEKRALAIAYHAGIAVPDLARAVGRHPAAVYKRIQVWGIDWEKRPNKAPRGPREGRHAQPLTLQAILARGQEFPGPVPATSMERPN